VRRKNVQASGVAGTDSMRIGPPRWDQLHVVARELFCAVTLERTQLTHEAPLHLTSVSIELAAGWNAERRLEFRDGHREEYVEVVPPTGDALLRFSSQQFPAGGFDDAEMWVERIALSNRARGRPVSSVRCGDLAGYQMSFVAGTELLRGWVLRMRAFPLDVCYRCDARYEGRDDVAVDGMLNALRFHGPAASP
jgi:hypothetical protein